MYFVLITAKHSPQELKTIVENLSPDYLKELNDLYNSFKWSEVDSATECKMYAIVDDKTLEELAKTYCNLEITWTFEDISKTTLYYDRDKVMLEEKFDEKLRQMIYDFVTVNTTMDVILDKINEIGSESLTAFDKEILKTETN